MSGLFQYFNRSKTKCKMNTSNHAMCLLAGAGEVSDCAMATCDS